MVQFRLSSLEYRYVKLLWTQFNGYKKKPATIYEILY